MPSDHALPFALVSGLGGTEQRTGIRYHARLKLKAPVLVFDTKSYAVPPEYFAQILSLFDENPESCAFLLKGHGQVALGKDVRDAAFNAELVEETAQIAVIGKMLLNTV